MKFKITTTKTKSKRNARLWLGIVTFREVTDEIIARIIFVVMIIVRTF